MAFSQPSVDQEFNNEIMALEVICNNHQWGCNWQGSYREASVSIVTNLITDSFSLKCTHPNSDFAISFPSLQP